MKKHFLISTRQFRSLCLFLLCFSLLNTPFAAAQFGSRHIIIAGSNVRVRHEPRLSAVEVGRLRFGSVVDVRGQTSIPEKIGNMEAVWYQLVLPDGRDGWVFGGLTRPFAPEQRGAIYRELIRDRLSRKTLSFSEAADALEFVNRVLPEIPGDGNAAEFLFARLRLLQHALNADWRRVPEFKHWLNSQYANETYWHEPAGQWFVQPERFWELQARYAHLPLADEIAWEAARIQTPGECEGEFSCELMRLNMTEGRYLALYPNGRQASEALAALAGTLEYYAGNEGVVTERQGDAELRQQLDQLYAAVGASSAPGARRVFQQLETISKKLGW